MLTESKIAIKTIVRELPADLETPISVYLKLRGDGPSFLLESVEGAEHVARYSFIGVRPRARYILRGDEIEVVQAGSARTVRLEPGADPTAFLQNELAGFQAAALPGLPRFIGGLVGYLGYECVRYFEPKLQAHMRPAQLPDKNRSVVARLVVHVPDRRQDQRRGGQ